jgi:hypothetical protein
MAIDKSLIYTNLTYVHGFCLLKIVNMSFEDVSGFARPRILVK